MQAGLSRTDRRLLWGFGGAGLLFAIGMVVLTPAEGEESSPVPSSYSADSGGALAAYLLLVDLHYPVHRWEDAPTALPDSGLLILAEPTEKPTRRERAQLLEFVQNGGRVLFCGASITSFFPGVALTDKTVKSEYKDFPASLPSHYSRGASNVVIRPEAYWSKLTGSQFRLYGDEQSSAAVSWQVGKGQILWWAAATPLTNTGIRRSGNLSLFLNTVTDPSSDQPLTVYWDEYFHGRRGSLWSYVENTPLPWGAIQIVLLASALLFTFSRRSGPVSMPLTFSRLSPLEFVDTMGGLYQRAGAASIAVGVSYKHLRLGLARHLGLPAALRDADLAKAAGQRLGFPSHELGEVLENAARAAAAPKLLPREALRLVRQLENHSARLNWSKSRTEKDSPWNI
jgi:hypothetical protein